jgi:carboxylesterase
MRHKIKILIVILLSLLAVILVSGLYLRTGFLQSSQIDTRDLNKWQFDEDGIILGAKEFTLNGSEDVCWFLIHGYTSTPDEMRELAEEIHSEFNETIFVTRLKGHGKVPSQIVDLTLYDWYEQVAKEYDTLNENCEKVNLIGFSFGGALATRLAENKDVNNVYLLSPYIFARYNWYYLFKLENYLDIFADILVYGKKNQIAQINSQEGLDKHIAYWNMPFLPIKNSKTFFNEVKSDLNKINAPILLQQSKNDKTSDIKSSIYIYENVKSENKDLIIFEKSNHVIQEDYDKKEVIKNILNFEKKSRK